MDKKKILEALASAGVVRFGEFTLVSGDKSPIYVDMRILPSYPKEFDTITSALADEAKDKGTEILCGMETAGIPLAAAMAVKAKLPMVYIRKKPKDYGTKSRIEGIIGEGKKALLVDDLITRGTSKLSFIDPVKDSGAELIGAIVILDREQGGEDVMMEKGVSLYKLVTLKELLSYMLEKKLMTEKQYEEVMQYLSSN